MGGQAELCLHMHDGAWFCSREVSVLGCASSSLPRGSSLGPDSSVRSLPQIPSLETHL